MLERYREFGPIFKETIAGVPIVHLMEPDYIKAMYKAEGKIPHAPPLLDTQMRFRKVKNLSPGLGNT